MIRLLLYHRRLRMFLLGSSLSSFGSAMSTVALPLYVLDHFHSPLLLGTVFVARELPGTLLALWIGWLVDRLGAFLSSIIALAVCGTGIGSIPFVAFSAVLTVTSSFVLGIGMSLLSPTVALYVPALVPDDELDVANGAFQSTFMVGDLLGTAVGGWVVSQGHYVWGFYGDALSYFLAAGTVFLVGNVNLSSKPLGRENTLEIFHGFRQLAETVTAQKTLLRMLIVDSGLYFAMGAINVALPLYTVHTLGRPWLYSIVLITSGIGELLAGFLAPNIRVLFQEGYDSKWYIGLASMIGLGYVLLVLWPSVAVALSISFVVSFPTGMLYVVYASKIQRSIPAKMMGRFQTVMAGSSSIFTGGGSVIAGLFGSARLGIGLSVVGLWLAGLVGTLVR